MTKEWELAQELPFAVLQETIPAAIEEVAQETESPNRVAAKPGVIEREIPRATHREVRAIRSLLYNRLLLEAVQRRIEKAEAIIISYLLTQDDTSAQIGSYLVEVDTDHSIGVTKTGNDNGWRQPHFPELETIPMT